MIHGRQSREVRQIGLGAVRRRFEVAALDGAHLFPLERPQATADAIRDMAAKLL